ncbi:hypothetical protein LTR05_002322 [Lithohypha guttulata]|uniref:Uncharacterized protein n=1 Tax=Lithohypha guttulata TaxID=1690604 RepID=A0AAN7Y7Z2_9EURO|nr:hypothetical protein LTR05_002322 [Lithohypha guttulata]
MVAFKVFLALLPIFGAVLAHPQAVYDDIPTGWFHDVTATLLTPTAGVNYDKDGMPIVKRADSPSLPPVATPTPKYKAMKGQRINLDGFEEAGAYGKDE